jgi:Protein of unknown function (DUF4079)
VSRNKAHMPQGLQRIAALLHPLAAVLAIAWLAFVASLGLRSRERGGAHLRPRHARLAPWALGAMVATAGFGALSTWLWRPDLDLASGWHFRVAVAVILLLATAATISRWIAADGRARHLHPLLGLLALLGALLQVFLGLGLLPL